MGLAGTTGLVSVSSRAGAVRDKMGDTGGSSEAAHCRHRTLAVQAPPAVRSSRGSGPILRTFK